MLPKTTTFENILKDYKGRKAGLMKALSTDVHKFHEQCNPETRNLCLYGLPNETWVVGPPAEKVPPELPDPALGINKVRDVLGAEDWLSTVAIHGDAWLIAVAFYLGGRYGFDKSEREKLFDVVNEAPTVLEAAVAAGVVELEKNQKKKNKSSKKYSSEDNKCGTCGGIYAEHEFWICCDYCEKWFHGKCVKITAAKADHIKFYRCLTCKTNKPKKSASQNNKRSKNN